MQDRLAAQAGEDAEEVVPSHLSVPDDSGCMALLQDHLAAQAEEEAEAGEKADAMRLSRRNMLDYHVVQQ